MSAANIKVWIASLGMTHGEMFSKSIIPDNELVQLFPGDDEFYFEPEIGLEINFAANTLSFRSLHITLLTTTPSTVKYTGELPEPFSLRMSQSDVHAIFGQPLEYSGPVSLPEPRGQTGGWEYYQLDAEVCPNVKIQFQYLESMEVSAIVFTRINED
jgi:hypothetical protein